MVVGAVEAEEVGARAGVERRPAPAHGQERALDAGHRQRVVQAQRVPAAVLIEGRERGLVVVRDALPGAVHARGSDLFAERHEDGGPQRAGVPIARAAEPQMRERAVEAQRHVVEGAVGERRDAELALGVVGSEVGAARAVIPVAERERRALALPRPERAAALQMPATSSRSSLPFCRFRSLSSVTSLSYSAPPVANRPMRPPSRLGAGGGAVCGSSSRARRAPRCRDPRRSPARAARRRCPSGPP